MKPKTTCTPARSRSRAQRMLASSSKRALISTSAVTYLPASAASASAATIGLVLRGAVERLLDRHHVRIARRLAQELDHHVEALERVVDEDVLLADRREAVAAVVADALGEARIEGLELQVRPVERDELATVRSSPACPRLEHRPVADFELLGDEQAQVLGHRRLDLDADHGAEAALLERRLEHADQILGLFLDLDVGVADHAEHALPLHRIAGEQAARMEDDDLLQGNETAGSGLREIRQPDEAVDFAGQANEPLCEPCRLPRWTSLRAIAVPRLGMNGKGCAGSMASGVSTGKTWLRK